jgi:hypothetical protein
MQCLLLLVLLLLVLLALQALVDLSLFDVVSRD